MFDEYKEAVLNFYLLKKETAQLSSNLESLQRSKLRNECLKIFRDKYDKKDDMLLRSFFDPSDQFNDHIESIEKVDLDRFRPLVSFLQRETDDIRDEAAIKLLAWLIGFDSYQDWKSNGGGSGGSLLSGILKVLKEILNATLKWPLPVKNSMMIYIILLLVGTGAFYLPGIGTTDIIRQPLADEKCMYWTGDHYEPAKCNTEIKDAVLIPINLKTLNHLRKINLKDTLTSYSIGKVWYSKTGNRHEYFTSGGIYPTDTLKRLKPLSKFILKHHVFYYRYLLICLMWSVCAVIIAVLFIKVLIDIFDDNDRIKALLEITA